MCRFTLQVRRSATPSSAKPEPAAQPPAAVANNGAGSAPADAAKVPPPAPAPAKPAEAAQQPSSDLAELKRVLATAVAAQEQYSQYSQEQVGAVFRMSRQVGFGVDAAAAPTWWLPNGRHEREAWRLWPSKRSRPVLALPPPMPPGPCRLPPMPRARQPPPSNDLLGN